MKTQRGFATILAIIIGLLIIGGGTYLYTSSDNESDNADEVQGNSIEDMVLIIKPSSSETYKQGDDITVRWETNGLSEEKLLLGFVKLDGSLECGSEQIVDPYLRNGVPISSTQEFGTDMLIGAPGSPGGVCVLNPGQYKIRLCVEDSDICSFSPLFNVISK